MKVLVTGASGFVGSSLVPRLCDDGHTVVAAFRRESDVALDGVRHVVVGELGSETQWREALQGVDVVVHTAARVHVMDECADDPELLYNRANVDGTEALARQASDAGVRRFVFLSSIKVNGEQTLPGQKFSSRDIPDPRDMYARSKLRAEQALIRVGQASPMDYAIIRPVLVYGPGVRANFAALIKWVAKGLPLPLAGIKNRRSLIALDNLVDVIVRCCEHPAAANQTFLVSDGVDLSTSELLQAVGIALGRPARLFPVPEFALRGLAAILGQSTRAARLLDSLQVDLTEVQARLDWQPPVSCAQQLLSTVAEVRGS